MVIYILFFFPHHSRDIYKGSYFDQIPQTECFGFGVGTEGKGDFVSWGE
jgi:hypothetical protein